MYRSYYNKFNRGEIDEKATVRDDVERIHHSGSLMENFLPRRLGAMRYRPGTELLGDVKTNEGHQIIEWQTPDDESVILEFSQSSAVPSVETLRVWLDDTLLTRPSPSDSLSNGTFTGGITGWTDDSDVGGSAAGDGSGAAELTGDGTGDFGRISQTITATATKRALRVVVSKAPVTIHIGSGTTAGSNDIFTGRLGIGIHSLVFTPDAGDLTITLENGRAYSALVDTCDFESSGTFEITRSMFPTDGGNADAIETIRVAQSADVMYLCGNSYEICGRSVPVLEVRRWGTESWSVTESDIVDGPFGPLNTSDVTLAVGATTGDTTLTASIPMFSDPESIGRLYQIVEGSTYGVCKVVGVTSATVAQVIVTVEMGGVSATRDWYEGLLAPYLPSPTYPSLFEGRLHLSGGGRIYASVSDAYTSFDQRIEGDSAAFTRTLAFGTSQRVNWLAEGDRLMIGLRRSEVVLDTNAYGDILTPDTARIRNLMTNVGSAPKTPVSISQVLYFVQRAFKKIIGIATDEVTGVGVEDATILHPNICEPGVRRMAAVHEPDPRIYAVLTDGTVRTYMFDKAESVSAWSRITIGGDTEVVDIETVLTGDEDPIYVIVERGGSRYLEKFARFDQVGNLAASRHYDSHVYYSSPGTTLSNLDHLEGETVYVWGDGKERGSYTVSSGSITVSDSWDDVVVGLRHVAKWESNRLARYVDATVLTARKRVVQIGLIMKNVALSTIRYGSDANNLDGIPLVDYDAASPPSTDARLLGTAGDADNFNSPVGLVQGSETLAAITEFQIDLSDDTFVDDSTAAPPVAVSDPNDTAIGVSGYNTDLNYVFLVSEDEAILWRNFDENSLSDTNRKNISGLLNVGEAVVDVIVSGTLGQDYFILTDAGRILRLEGWTTFFSADLPGSDYNNVYANFTDIDVYTMPPNYTPHPYQTSPVMSKANWSNKDPLLETFTAMASFFLREYLYVAGVSYAGNVTIALYPMYQDLAPIGTPWLGYDIATDGSDNGSNVLHVPRLVQDVSSYVGQIDNLAIANHGKRMWVYDSSSEKQLKEFFLTRAFDPTSVVLAGEAQVHPFGTQVGGMEAIGIPGLPVSTDNGSDEGLLLISNLSSQQMELKSVRSAIHGNFGVDLYWESGDDSATISGATTICFTFSADGTQAFEIKIPNIDNPDEGFIVHRYTLSVAFELATLAETATTFDFSSVETHEDTLVPKERGVSVRFNNIGTWMFILTQEGKVHSFSLSTAWDITTATYDSSVGPRDGTSADVSEELAYIGPRFTGGSHAEYLDFWFSSDGTKMYVVGQFHVGRWLMEKWNFNTDLGSVNDFFNRYAKGVVQYNLSSAFVPEFKVQQDGFVQDGSLDVRSPPYRSYALCFSDDGKVLLLSDQNLVLKFYLQTAWDLNSGVYTGRASTGRSGLTSIISTSLLFDGDNAVIVVGEGDARKYAFTNEYVDRSLAPGEEGIYNIGDTTFTTTTIQCVTPGGAPVLGNQVSSTEFLGNGVADATGDTIIYVSSDDVLVVVDITDPLNPTIQGTLGHADIDTVTAVAAAPNLAVLASSGVDKLVVVNFSDPAEPEVQMSVENTIFGDVDDMALVGSTILVLTNGLLRSVSFTGELLDFAGGLSGGQVVAVDGSYAYVVSNTNRFYTVDASNPYNLIVIGSFTDSDLGGAKHIQVQGTYAYVATTGGRITIVDVSDLSDPSKSSSFTDSELGDNDGMQVFGRIVYTISTDDDSVAAVDFTSEAFVDYDKEPFEFNGIYDTDSRVYLQVTGPAEILALTYDVDDADNPPA